MRKRKAISIFDMPGIGKKIRRNVCVFLLAVIYAFVFFKVSILYQESRNKTRQERQHSRGSKITHTKEILSHFHREPRILLKSLENKLKREVTTKKINNTSVVGKMASTLEAKITA